MLVPQLFQGSISMKFVCYNLYEHIIHTKNTSLLQEEWHNYISGHVCSPFTSLHHLGMLLKTLGVARAHTRDLYHHSSFAQAHHVTNRIRSRAFSNGHHSLPNTPPSPYPGQQNTVIILTGESLCCCISP